MHEDMAMLNVREGLVALLPRLRRFALILCGSAAVRDAVLRRACAGMLDAPHRFQQGMDFDRLVYAQVYRVWASSLSEDEDAPFAGGADGNMLPPSCAGDSVPDDTARLIETLAPQTRAALLLVHSEHFTLAEAARVLDVTEDLLIARVTRARIGLTDFVPGGNLRSSGLTCEVAVPEIILETNDRTQ